MSFNKRKTVRVSERVFDMVCEVLDIESSENYVKIDGWLQVFNNDREQGFYLTVTSIDYDNPNMTKKHLYVWACEQGNSDDILVIWSTKYPFKGIFDDDAYNNNKMRFRYNQYYEASDYIINLVKGCFAEEFKDNDEE